MDLNTTPPPKKREELKSSYEFSTKKCKYEEKRLTKEYILKINHAYFFAMRAHRGCARGRITNRCPPPPSPHRETEIQFWVTSCELRRGQSSNVDDF